MCKDETVPERNFVSEVLPNLFVGGVEPARERSILIEKFGITHVVNATQRETNHFEDVIHYYNAPVLDVPRYFRQDSVVNSSHHTFRIKKTKIQITDTTCFFIFCKKVPHRR